MARLKYHNALLTLFFFVFSTIDVNFARKHKLELKNDVRTYFVLSSFGFYDDGVLDVHMRAFSFHPFNQSQVFGFSLDKTSSNAISPYLENHQEECVLEDEKRDVDSMSVIFFAMDLNSKRLKVTCSESMQSLHIKQETYSEADPTVRQERAANKLDKFSDNSLFSRRKRAETQEDEEEEIPKPVTVTTTTAPVTKKATKPASVENDKVENSSENKTKQNQTHDAETVAPEIPDYIGQQCGKGLSFMIREKKENGVSVFETAFTLRILKPEEEGLYGLYFHNCPNYKRSQSDPETSINLSIDIVEVNGENYLSAGQIPLPTVYFCMATLFFFSGCFWVHVLRKSSSADVFKIHYLMALLVFVKSSSLLFHGINFHFIETYGIHIEGWAVLYYITHLLKGALLFITIVLIGTGWALIKHIVSDKEKKIFMIVIPLQVLANVAEIIIEESEEGELAHSAWREVFILVDLLCCGAILFPVVWSIKHLQEASQTDGKAAINLFKLKLFRHFYIMIVCYIYFTRIIVYLLKITVPFKYEWLDETFRGLATFIFFVMTGYKFRPASNNPYLQLPQDDGEIEMEEVLTKGGMSEGLSKLGRNKIEESDKLSKQESSHEYD